MDIVSALRAKAKSLGFSSIGFIEPCQPPHFRHFQDWLSQEKYGELTWLKRNLDLRQDPRRVLEGCRAIVCLAIPYPESKGQTADGLTIARYASSPLDYHAHIKGLGRELVALVKAQFPESRSRVFVDSGPVLERSLAFQSGLGFFGKNNTLICPGFGSYVHLAEILTTAPLPLPSLERKESACGECNRCVEACPTGALERPFLLNVSKCLSYLTVEYGGELPAGTGRKMGSCFYGCDRCQEVCPFNGQERGDGPRLPSSGEILAMNDQEFTEMFGKTALARGGLERVKRNILAILKEGTVSRPLR